MPARNRLTGYLKAAGLTLIAVGILGASAGAVTNETHRFRLYIAGIPAATITISAAKTGSRYALAGSLQPNAFLRAFKDVGYTGTSSGSYKGINYKPSKYHGSTKTGSRSSTVRIRFRGNRAIVKEYSPTREKRPYDIDPTSQRGALDLLTASYLLFGDSPADVLCDRTIPMFDGRRRSALTLAKPVDTGSGATCKGTYTRIAGFPPDEMKERVNFPFKLVYDRLDDGSYRLRSFKTKTTFGTASAVRK